MKAGSKTGAVDFADVGARQNPYEEPFAGLAPTKREFIGRRKRSFAARFVQDAAQFSGIQDSVRVLN